MSNFLNVRDFQETDHLNVYSKLCNEIRKELISNDSHSKEDTEEEKKAINKLTSPDDSDEPLNIVIPEQAGRNAIKGIWLPFKTEEINLIISYLKQHSAPGTDKISNEVIKNLLTLAINILTYIFNRILETGEIPEEWLVVFRQTDIPTLEKRFRAIEETRDKFISYQEELEELLEESDALFAHREEFENSYFTAFGIATKL
ncbi:hypothetical protein KQX54_020007 [Cotesia glomerata]|uniref:Uncharacterized protein n=1 Tax=Cotesia glomerata TaxID=32391 RepID=A0AAV7INU1_COTGL|nr:hypothetical protein KQX54_020007 [Cotesia glomerata]